MVPSRRRADIDIDVIAAAVARVAAAWTAETRVCVALSGGVDSTVLLHAMVALRASTEVGFSLTAHHVHHGLSPDADTWTAHCAEVCTRLGVPLRIERVHVDRAARVGIEAAARDARYRSLDSLDTDVVLLAHHARDQAETLLLQLLRGAGPAGLAAMPIEAGRYLRPLLGMPKADVQRYAEVHALTWVEDQSNTDPRFSRNRLRLNVWPALIESFPSAEVTLSRAAAHQAHAAQLLIELAEIDAALCVDAGALVLSGFNRLSEPRRANLLRYWLDQHHIATLAANTLHEWLLQLGNVAVEQSIELRVPNAVLSPTSVRVYRGNAMVVHEHDRWQPREWAGEAMLTVTAGNATVGTVTFHNQAGPNALRAPLVGEHWYVRPRQEGDRIALSARSGHVTLKNIFQAANIPPWQREHWPLLICNKEIACVVGIATAEAFRVAQSQTDCGSSCEWKPA